MGILADLGVDEDRLTEIMKIHQKSMDWMYRHWKDIQECHAGKFIAIKDEKIIAEDKNRVQLENQLKNDYSKKDAEEIFIEYVNPKGYVFIL